MNPRIKQVNVNHQLNLAVWSGRFIHGLSFSSSFWLRRVLGSGVRDLRGWRGSAIVLSLGVEDWKWDKYVGGDQRDEAGLDAGDRNGARNEFVDDERGIP
jgi:hypothetical protein